MREKLSTTLKIVLALFMATFSSGLVPATTAYATTQETPVTITNQTETEETTTPETTDEDSTPPVELEEVAPLARNQHQNESFNLPKLCADMTKKSNFTFPAPGSNEWTMNSGTISAKLRVVNPLPVCEDVTIYLSSYTMPNNWDQMSFPGGNALPQVFIQSDSITFKKGVSYSYYHSKTLKVPYPTDCKNVQVDLYYGPEITNVTTAGHDGVYISHKFIKRDNRACVPTVKPCVEVTHAPVITSKEQFADYAYQDTRSKGHHEFVNNGLRIYTDDASSEAKVAWYHSVNFPLADAGEPSMTYEVTTGIKPGLQMVVDFDGDGSSDGILVGEEVYGNDWWLSNGSKQFVKDNAPSHTGGSGSDNHGTLNQWLANFPDAKVQAVGFSLGSGVYANGIIRSLTFGCVKYTFDKAKVTPAEPVFVDPTCEIASGRVTITATKGVTYKVNGEVKVAGTYSYPAGSSVVVTAHADNGYKLGYVKTKWHYTFGTQPTNCTLGETDVCPNLEGSQATVPNGYLKVNDECGVIAGGMGGGLPAQLPATGGETRFNPLMIVLASVAAYGATYFVQNRRLASFKVRG